VGKIEYVGGLIFVMMCDI